MIPWSVFIWLIFEAANLSLQNWYYINLPHRLLSGGQLRRRLWNVLPGLFETTELLETVGCSEK